MSNVISITTDATYRTSRTPDEVSAELSRLAKLRDIVPACSRFGDDNHAAIDAQMRVLHEGMSTADVTEEWDTDNVDPYVLSATLDAAEWLRGEGAAPSDGWLDMVGDEERVN